MERQITSQEVKAEKIDDIFPILYQYFAGNSNPHTREVHFQYFGEISTFSVISPKYLIF